MNSLVSITVPNLDTKQLNWFLKTNWQVLNLDITKGRLELIIASSADPKLLKPIQRRYPKLRIINLKLKSVGFAKTVNAGFRQVDKGALWLGTVNDDVALPRRWLTNLIKAINEMKMIGSINPVIVNLKLKNVESAGIEVLPIGRAVPITQVPEKPTLVDATNAACVLYNAQALKKVGFFDERFESYLEDIDLSLRLKRAGYKNIVVPGVVVYHLKHTTSQKTLTSKRRAWLNLRNWWYILLKNWSLKTWLRHLLGILLERGRNFSGWLKV